MRSIPFYPLMVILLVGLGGYLGCDPNNIEIPSGLAPTSNAERETASGNLLSGVVNPSSTIPPRTVNTLLVGSFNMERLGPSKIADSWVMERFAEIIRQFDVIALQEITSKDQRTVPISSKWSIVVAAGTATRSAHASAAKPQVITNSMHSFYDYRSRYEFS